MPNTITPFGFVKKSGDTMTGNLAMSAGKTVDGVDVSDDLVRKAGDTMTGTLYFQSGAYKAGMRAKSDEDDVIEVVGSEGNPIDGIVHVSDLFASSKVDSNLIDCHGSILMDAGFLVDGVDLSECTGCNP